MQVLIIGSGGREHALAWQLARSPQVKQIFCAPGNAGIAQIAKCVPLSPTDIEGLLRFATVQNISLTVVGPEVPLVAGIVDQFQAAGLMIFGPTAAAAQLEGSKAWTKQLLVEAGIPTATAQVFTDLVSAIAAAKAHALPVVVKADGLAAGKGVTVAQSHAEAIAAIEALFADVVEATVVLESFLEGAEASVLALTDGETILTLLPAQDHKRIGEGDTGPNTGGMGAYAPAPLVTEALLARIEAEILQPTLAALQRRGIHYQGVLYAGLMISPHGDPSVVEYNCRFGDPETQAILPLLESDLFELLRACCTGTLATQTLTWQVGASACVVVAAGGYPGRYQRGQVIAGLDQPHAALVFHAGTSHRNDTIVTDGGRVFGVTGRGETLEAAIAQAYATVGAIQFEGMVYRRDIGHRALSA